jgi:hypothetical protein
MKKHNAEKKKRFFQPQSAGVQHPEELDAIPPMSDEEDWVQGGTDVAYGEGDIGEESFDITVTREGGGTGIKSYGNLGSSQEWGPL